MESSLNHYDQESLQQYLEGSLSDSKVHNVEQHLQHCERCQQLAFSIADNDSSDLNKTLIEKIRRWYQDDSVQETTDFSANPENVDTNAHQAKPTPDDTFDFLSPPEQEDEVGRLGGYRILQVLGQGGMGVVFKAEDPALQRLVALKVMRPALAIHDQSRARFLREAQAAASLKHDNIVTIYQVGQDGTVPFLAMEFLHGISLEDAIRQPKALPLTKIYRIGKELAQGLHAAHEIGLIHRDIKPGNIWLDSDNDGRVKLLDFGLARAMSESAKVTQSGMVVGTPAYMAPEQASGAEVDHRCDIFSLGCVLYELCTGKRPFRGKDPMSILMALATQEPTPTVELNSDIPEEFDTLILQLLDKSPDSRPESAAIVARQLQQLANEVSLPSSPLSKKQQEEAETVTYIDNQPITTRSRQRLYLILASIAALLAFALVFGPAFMQSDGKSDKDNPNSSDGHEHKGGLIIQPQPVQLDLKPGDPMGDAAWVRKPTPLKGALSWTIITKSADPPFYIHAIDGDQAVSLYDRSSAIRIWNFDRQKTQRVLIDGGDDAIVSWSPDTKHLATISHGKPTIKIWDYPSFKLLRILKRNDIDKLSRMAWGPHGKELAVTTKNGEVIVWDLQLYTPTRLFRFDKEGPWVTPTWSPDGRYISVPTKVTASPFEMIRVWDVPNGQKHFDLQVAGNNVFGPCTWHLEKNRIYARTEDSICAFNSNTGKLEKQWQVTTTSRINFSPDRTEFTAQIDEEKMGIWSTDNFQQIYTFPPYSEKVNGPTYFGNFLIMFTFENTYIYDRKTRKLLWTIQGKSTQSTPVLNQHNKQIGHIVFVGEEGRIVISPDGHYQCSAKLEDEILYVAQTKNGQETFTPQEFQKQFGWVNDPGKLSSELLLKVEGPEPIGDYELEFDGNSFVNIPTLRYDGNQPITLETWVTLGNPPLPYTGAVVSDTQTGGIAISTEAYTKIMTLSFAGGEGNHHDGRYDACLTSEDMIPMKRAHLAAVWDLKQVRLYVNGILASVRPLPTKFKPSVLGFTIGASPTNIPPGANFFFKGRIDEVRISKAAIYKANFKPSQWLTADEDTMALYHLEKGMGDVAEDSSGNGHHGKIINPKWHKHNVNKK